MRKALVWLTALMGAGAMSVPEAAGEGACQDIASRYVEAGRNVGERSVNSFFFEAAGADCLALVEQLLAAGGSVKVRGRDGDGALHHAARAGADEVVTLLIARGAAIDLRDLKGATPLYEAVQADRVKTAELLLEKGADPNIEGRAGVTPLEAAAFNGNRRLVELLLKWKADPRHIDRTGKNAVVYSAARGFTDIVERLIATGIDVNARYGNELTALMWAAGHSNDVPDEEGAATVTMLLEKGARSDNQDNRGRTALMIAAEAGHARAVDILLAHGANPNLKDKEGKSARDLAATDDIKLALSR
ncbi:MAG TPA: ankyrin repeat domain-containing protein [Aestuariivirgaceae bacterium]|jgi:ankyrin repeat protein